MHSKAAIVETQSGLVVSEHQIASKVGADILRSGGNAIDAAVAVGYVLAVVNPCCGNIGGGGFMTIHLANGKNVFINFREKAPLKANKNLYVDQSGNLIPNASLSGYTAVGTPGTVLGFETVLNKYGTLPRKKVMAAAIEFAQNGFSVTSYLQKQIEEFANDFRSQPNVAAIFLKNNEPLAVGELLKQNDLAQTLKQIANLGSNYFYHGPIAKRIVNASMQNGGFLTLADFNQYQVEELTPVYCNYRGYDIITSPPPSSGGVTLCEILNILENFPLNKLGYRSAQSARIIIEAMRYGFIDRNTKLGDPNFVKNPVDELLSKEYAKKLSHKILTKQHQQTESVIYFPELTDTTHYSVVDNKGNAVSVTYTLNGFFGAKVIAENTGFFLNNEMDDFSLKKDAFNKFGLLQASANRIEPAKRPLSSMTPTIIMKNGKVVMVLGSPGGPRIISTVLLTILNVIDYGMNIEAAIAVPRFHYQAFPNTIDVEPLAFPYITTKELEWLGYHLTSQKPWGAVEIIHIDLVHHTLHGVNDVRRPDGAAVGF